MVDDSAIRDEGHIDVELRRVLYDLRNIALSVESATKRADEFLDNHPDVHEFFKNVEHDLQNAFVRASDALPHGIRVVRFANRVRGDLKPFEKGDELSERYATDIGKHEEQVIRKGLLFDRKLEAIKSQIKHALRFTERTAKHLESVERTQDVLKQAKLWNHKLLNYLRTLHMNIANEITLLRYLFGMEQRIETETERVVAEDQRIKAKVIRGLAPVLSEYLPTLERAYQEELHGDMSMSPLWFVSAEYLSNLPDTLQDIAGAVNSTLLRELFKRAAVSLYHVGYARNKRMFQATFTDRRRPDKEVREELHISLMRIWNSYKQGRIDAVIVNIEDRLSRLRDRLMYGGLSMRFAPASLDVVSDLEPGINASSEDKLTWALVAGPLADYLEKHYPPRI